MYNTSQNIIAIIPARGNSKRLPRKNILDFLGRPILQWTIESAIDTGIFQKIIVSSEDTEILQIARDLGVDTHVREMKHSLDHVTVETVCQVIVEECINEGMQLDLMCCLYATSPLRTAQDILKTVEIVANGNCDKAFAATSFELPVHQAVRINDFSGSVDAVFPDLIDKRSDQIGTFWVDNGSTYVSRISTFIKDQSFLTGNVAAYKMPRERSIDIDTQYDYEMALFIAQRGLVGRDIK